MGSNGDKEKQVGFQVKLHVCRQGMNIAVSFSTHPAVPRSSGPCYLVYITQPTGEERVINAAGPAGLKMTSQL